MPTIGAMMDSKNLHPMPSKGNPAGEIDLAFAAPGRHVTAIAHAVYCVAIEESDASGGFDVNRRDPVGSLLEQLGAHDHEIGLVREALVELRREGLIRFLEGRARWELAKHEELAA